MAVRIYNTENLKTWPDARYVWYGQTYRVAQYNIASKHRMNPVMMIFIQVMLVDEYHLVIIHRKEKFGFDTIMGGMFPNEEI